MQAVDGELPIAIDSSPNHCAFMSITVTRLKRLENGTEEPTTTILDFVELPSSHLAENMAEALTILKEYGLDGKVS